MCATETVTCLLLHSYMPGKYNLVSEIPEGQRGKITKIFNQCRAKHLKYMPDTVLITNFENSNAGICQLFVQNSSADSSQIV